MTLKAEALIYAEELEEYGEFQTYFDGVAAELRRQHDEIKRLHEVKEDLLDVLKLIVTADSDDFTLVDFKYISRAAIARATGVTKE